MKRLYCSLRGGMGNQLFQVAHGLALAEQFSAELVIDDGWFRGRRLPFETARTCCLPWFVMDARLASPAERWVLAVVDLALKLQKRLRWRLLPIHHEALPLSPRRLQRAHAVVVHGHWQDHGLMARQRPLLQQQFQVRPGLLSATTQAWIETIASTPNSVFVHVRRGDYVSDRRTAQAHGVCPPEYYARALTALRQRLGAVPLYLFSDDMDWAQQHLPLQDWSVTAVQAARWERAELVDLAEFELMRRARHGVLANSSFSWWAAFLSEAPGSVIIAPKQWFSWGAPQALYGPDWLLL